MTSCDVVVVGAGHNGLVAAGLLAKSGRSVLIVESAGDIGGAARTIEFAPGFRVSALAHILNRLHPDVVKLLDLERHGLSFEETEMPSVALRQNGAPLILNGAYGASLTGASSNEAAAWATLRAQLLRFAGILKPMLARRPPDPAGMSFTETASLGITALSLRRLGKEDMRDFLRMLLTNVADVLDEHLADDRLKGLLAFDAVLGSHLGPRSPTSLLGLYYRLTGELAGEPGAQMLPTGGMGTVITAIASAATAVGATIRTGCPVSRIMVEKGAVAGVELATGETIRAPIVVSAIHPRTTFLQLVGPRELDTGFVRSVGNIRTQGHVAKLNLALNAVPTFAGLAEPALHGRLVIAPSTDHVERAFNPSKYGEFSPEPVMEITLPSLSDPALAPHGACVLSALVQFVPYALKQGWDAAKPALLAAVMRQLEAFSPGIGKLVRHADLLTPLDIEARYSMPGGHWHHGELQADQMLMSRPVSGASGYDAPIGGLYLASAGAHPGGGVSGVPGLNAARRILAVGG